MTIDEMTVKLVVLEEEIATTEDSELQASAELGRKAFAEIENNPEYEYLVNRVKSANEKLVELRDEYFNLKDEFAILMEKITCFFCKTVNPENSEFCEECGAKLGVKPREYCINCGTMNRPEQKYCGECGTKLPPKEEEEKSLL